MKNILWKSTKNQYTVLGVSFGFLFPIFSTLVESWSKYGLIDFPSLVLTQTSNPLLWVINSAPFFLGLFARVAGSKQETAEIVNVKVQEINNSLREENEARKSMENKLKEMIAVYSEDLESAKLIQEFSLPELPNIKECKFSFKYLPLNLVGGDLMSIVKLKEGGISILVGDVVGHGISAALITSLVKVLSNKICRVYATNPREYLNHLNQEVNKYLPQDYYLTAIYGYLNFIDNKATFNFSRGGHPYPFVYSSVKKETTIYEIPGTPIGLLENLSYSEQTINLDSGDRVYLITDGFIEIYNQSKKLLGVSGLSKIISEANTKHLNLDESIDFIIKETKKYSDNIDATDDRLILGMEIL